MSNQEFYDLLLEEAVVCAETAEYFKKEFGVRDGNYRLLQGKLIAICGVLATMAEYFDIEAKPMPCQVNELLF